MCMQIPITDAEANSALDIGGTGLATIAEADAAVEEDASDRVRCIFLGWHFYALL